MNFAIIKTGAKQYRVTKGDLVKIEKITGEPKDKVEFDQVLLVQKDKTVKIGQPLVKGAKVKAEIVKQARAKKVIVFKYKPKKRYKKKRGHRQNYTQVKILKINA